MQIKILTEYDCSNAPLTLHKDYLLLMGDSPQWAGGYVDNKLAYILPFIEKKKLIFHYIQFLAETLVLLDLNREQEFLNSLVNYLKSLKKYDFITQPPTHVVFSTFPNNSIYAPFGSYIVDLSLDEELLWKNIHTKHKNVIRRAQKNNVVIKFGNNLFDQAYELISATLQRNHIHIVEKNKLETLLRNRPEWFLVGCSYLNSEIQSTAIILFTSKKAFYFWGGTTNSPFLGSNNLLHWEIIKKLKSLGVKQYNFVGARIKTNNSRILGIQQFKSRFGSTLSSGYLWKYPLNKWKYYLFNILYRLKMKKGDIIDQEKNYTNI